MPDPRPVIALIIILFLIFSPDPPAQTLQQITRLEDVLAKERADLALLNSSNFLDFQPSQGKWLNLTGFTNDTGFTWSYLDEFRARSESLARHALGSSFISKAVGVPVGDPLPQYRNISGVVRGEWLRADDTPNQQPPHLNLSNYAGFGAFGEIQVSEFGRNLTGKNGKLTVRLTEDESTFVAEQGQSLDGQSSDLARFVTAHIEMENTDGHNDFWSLQIHGVHFLETGHVLLSTTSDKFGGIYALPQFAQSPYFARLARTQLSSAINATINRQQEGFVRSLAPFASGSDGNEGAAYSVPNCELVAFFQQQLAPSDDTLKVKDQSAALRKLEDELRHPVGARTAVPHPLTFSMVAFSPDCGYAFQSKGPPANSPADVNHLSGTKSEIEQQHARTHVLFYINVLALQLWLLTRQMKEASTPSVRSRISFYTISMLALGDGFTTMAFALISLFVPGLWVLLMATCFLAFLSVSFFGMRFLMEIWSVQAPERERQDRERRAAAASSNPDMESSAAAATQINISTEPGLRPTVNAPPPRVLDAGSMPIFIPSDQAGLVGGQGEQLLPTTAPTATNTQTTTERRFNFGALYTRFYFLLLATLFLSLNATSWPTTIRRIYFITLAFMYLSFWVPQIYRNAYRNCRRALTWEFVLGQSLLRLSPFAYFYGYGGNILLAEADVNDLFVLAAWLWIQISCLVSQEIFGPRWFLKSHWLPPAYDYHPVLREDEEGGNLPVGASSSSSSKSGVTSTAPRSEENKDTAMRVFDCAVCMQDIEVTVQGPDSVAEMGISGAAALLARRAYMVTPCRHIFHAKCLEGWMKYRLQCPICREDLPPM